MSRLRMMNEEVINIFTEFRQVAKDTAKQQGKNYALIAKDAGLEESTIKGFMCGANDSRRIAEKIADVLGIKLIYSNGEYIVESPDDSV